MIGTVRFAGTNLFYRRGDQMFGGNNLINHSKLQSLLAARQFFRPE